MSNHSSYLRKVFPTPGLPEQNRVALPDSPFPSPHLRNSSVCKNHSPKPSCLRALTSLWRVLGSKGDSQFKTLTLSSTYVILVVVLLLLVLLLFIWFKLFIRPAPVAFGSGCVEGFIFLCGEGAAKLAKAIEDLEVEKAIEYLEVEAQQERGSCRRT